MRYFKKSVALISLAAFCSGALAQEEEKAPGPFTYATYFYCDVAGQDAVDEFIKTKNAPVYDQLVKDGVISSWGWMAHHTGGKWRRIQYYQAASVDAILDAQAEMDKRFEAMDDGSENVMGQVCEYRTNNHHIAGAPKVSNSH